MNREIEALAGSMCVWFFLCSRLLEVRSRIYELITHCIPPVIIVKVCLGGNNCLFLEEVIH